MADVKLNHVYKVYDGGVKAVSDFNIDIKDKEFIVFVGPSGCGKSTTLRMIAGLEDITAGDLFIGNTLVNDVQPKDRDIAMVFQNYALYPHMTVYENMAFSLQNRHMPKEEINRRVLEAAKILDIEPYLQRKPKAMSGGQRQRVSLGRAIVRQPKVFLLDEPLSNLDAKLRAQMRTEISKLHKKLETTFIYVTHDQVEAMTMGTRIVVMKLGFVQQIDTPTNLYNHPVNKFVAGFIGTPQMNFFDVTLNRNNSQVEITFNDNQKIEMNISNFYKCNPKYLHGDIHCTLGVRPDNLKLCSKDEKGVELIITEIEKLGNETLLYCDMAKAVVIDEKVNRSNVIVKVAPTEDYKVGDKISVLPEDNLIHLFDNETEYTIMPYIPTSTFQNISFKGDSYVLFGKTFKRFDAWKDIADGENYTIEIPHEAIVPGNDFELDVVDCEKIDDGKYLTILHNSLNDSFITVLCYSEYAKGSKYTFSLLYPSLKLEEKLNCKAISKETSIIGNFVKVNEKDENDYRLLKAKEIKEKEEFNVEKLISKLYLSLEEKGANKEFHNRILNNFDSQLNTLYPSYKDAIKEVKSLQEKLTKLQESKIDEASYLEIKNKALDISKKLSKDANTAIKNSGRLTKVSFKDFELLNEQDKKTALSNGQKIIDSFVDASKEYLDAIKNIKFKDVYQKGLDSVTKAINSVFTSHRLFTEEFATQYCLDKLSNYKETEAYKTIMKNNNKEDDSIFAVDASIKLDQAKCDKLNTKLFKELVSKYLLSISATNSYIRGLFLGNNTRWHEDASKNADETFELYKSIHNLYVDTFTLANKVSTSDFVHKSIVNYYINLCGAKYRLSDSLINRLFSVEGNKLLKNKYRFVITPKVYNPTIASEAEKNFNISHDIIKVKKYPNYSYVEAKFGDIVNDIEITSLQDSRDYIITADQDKGFAIYTLDTEIRIA